MTKVAISGMLSLRVILPVVLFSVPDQAQASILSIVTSIFSAQASAAVQDMPVNSQKIALLEAPSNPNIRAGSSTEVLTDDGALVPEVVSDATDYIALPASNEITTYTVQSGDTIGSIAKKYGISTNTILWANDLKRTSALKVGQKLIILPISGIQHKVRSGDTVQSLAKKYKGDADEIVAFNDLDDAKLKIGDIIVIPDGELTGSAPASTAKKLTSTGLGVSISDTESRGYYSRPISAGTRTQGLHGNNGVDLADSCGTPLYASAAGSVIISKDGGWNGGYGSYVVINHSNGSQTLYSHMQDVAVGIGDSVTKGQYIGTVGNTGKVSGVTGCHVHFEIRNGARNPF